MKEIWAIRIVKRIERAHHKAYIVGGSVRDILLEKTPKDFDIATDAPISVLESLFTTHDIGKSKDFGIVVARVDGHDFEIAHFRADGEYDGRKPKTVTAVGSFKEDASRRDFTINAMALTASGEIIDHFGGKKDLKSGVIRTVGDPEARFKEDRLRMMRAVRFATALDFTIEKGTARAIKRLAGGLKELSPERIREEMVKATTNGAEKFARYIVLLDELKLLRVILPEISALRFKPNTHLHHPESPNVFGHTIMALSVADTSDPLVLFSILFHDIGKLITHSVGRLGTSHHTYHSHDKEGIKLLDDILKRLRFSNDHSETIRFAVKHHLRFLKIPIMKDSKVTRLACDKDFEVLEKVAFADWMSRTNAVTTELDAIKAKVTKLKESFSPAKIKVLFDGKRIMRLTNLKPSPEVGKIKRDIADWIIDNNIKLQREVDNHILTIGRK